ncbi:MAG: methyltransferase [Rhizobiaceae bacterium]|jgi:tRNA1(Val) A37 N6-methylase TrmN6|nr:methyltransferase [Rhizobiaceae bacterium]
MTDRATIAFDEAGTTVDAFHRGRFVLVQPARSGHRSGIDAMLLAACVPDGFSGSVVDLGAGAGAAGLAVLSRCPDARATLVENDALMAHCARLSLARPENRHLAPRGCVVEADVTLRGAARRGASLGDDAFDFAILNPPFNDARDRRTPDARKAAAHVMGGTMFEDWMRTVTAIVRPGGGFALIARPESLGVILPAIGRRFGGLRLRGVHPHQGAAATRLLVTGVKGSRARLTLLPPHVLHEKGRDAFLPEADAVNNGLSSLA